MAYPGNPSGDERPNEQAYSFPTQSAGAYPPPPAEPQPAPDYGQPAAFTQPAYQPAQQPVSPAYGPPVQPVSPAYGPPAPDYGAQSYAQPVPPQPAPMHDQGPSFASGTAQLPTYGDPNAMYGYDNNPMSGPPVSPSPIGPVSYGPVQQPEKKRGVAVPILASLLALAVIAAGVFVGLYVDKSGKLDKSQRLASDRQTTINTTNAELDKTKKDLQTKTDELTKAQQDLRGSENNNAQTKAERDIIALCLKLLTEALTASANGDRTTMNKKIEEMRDPCNKADAIIG
jgi:hypothetical protein